MSDLVDSWRPAAWLRRKLKTLSMQLRYVLGDDSPAFHFHEQFRRTSLHPPVPGRLGQVRGHGSQTVVADFELSYESPVWRMRQLVLKYERIPGIIPRARLADELRNEKLARCYLGSFMPATLRVVGHGMNNQPSALTYQQRIDGEQLRNVPLRRLLANVEICRQMVAFCDAVMQMAKSTGQTPDLCGTLPRLDHLSNLFWRSRNVLVDFRNNKVWLVDTGWKEGEESLVQGRLRSRIRTRFRLMSLRFYRWRLWRALNGHSAANAES